jgi:Protein of unknown function (DUF992)
MNRATTSLIAAATGIVLAFPAARTQAQSKVEAGTLTCKGKGGVGLILGSKTSYQCSFVPAGGKRTETYAATVTRVGIDIGVTGNTVMVWAVLAASSSLAPGALRGSYVGAAADASVGAGGGAKLLIGGSQRSITLQPLSVQGQGGVNLAVGVAELAIR